MQLQLRRGCLAESVFCDDRKQTLNLCFCVVSQVPVVPMVYGSCSSYGSCGSHSSPGFCGSSSSYGSMVPQVPVVLVVAMVPQVPVVLAVSTIPQVSWFLWFPWFPWFSRFLCSPSVLGLLYTLYFLIVSWYLWLLRFLCFLRFL